MTDPRRIGHGADHLSPEAAELERRQLLALLEQGPADTFTIGRQLGIKNVWRRVVELERRGYIILPHDLELFDHQSQRHRVTVLYLSRKTYGVEDDGESAQ